MIIVKLLEILFPPTSEMGYVISDLSVITSVGSVKVQGPHMDTVSDTSEQNISFLYSITDSTSLIFWDKIGTNTLYPTRVHVPPGSLLLFGGKTLHSGSDYNSPIPHYRMHGYIDNVHVSHKVNGFGLLDLNKYNVHYDALQP